MDSATGGKQHLVFTDAEINAVASIVKAVIIEGVDVTDGTVIDVYERLLDVTASAKIRLRYELYHLEADGGETEQ